MGTPPCRERPQRVYRCCRRVLPSRISFCEIPAMSLCRAYPPTWRLCVLGAALLHRDRRHGRRGNEARERDQSADADASSEKIHRSRLPLGGRGREVRWCQRVGRTAVGHFADIAEEEPLFDATRAQSAVGGRERRLEPERLALGVLPSIFAATAPLAGRRDGRVAEGARLESVYTGNRIVGSNPTPSANVRQPGAIACCGRSDPMQTTPC